jgi:DNA-binding NarL/FixJ family response regulator
LNARCHSIKNHTAPGQQAPVRPRSSDTLTGREREIAHVLAAGHSTRAIAEELVITGGTVEVLSNIF